jgi:Flp pilus assembly protein TadG
MLMRRLARMWRSRSGLAAVELGLVAPVLVVLLLGSLALCNILACRQKVIDVGSNVSELIAMVTAVTSSDISNAYSAGNSMMYPFSTSNVAMVISSITYSAATHLDTVAWSRAENASPLLQGSVVTPPAGVIAATDGASTILVSVSYSYTSPFGLGTIPMSFSFYSRPRRSTSVACNGC